MMYKEDKFCLYAENAQPFLKNRVGDKVKLTIDAVVTSVGYEPNFDPMGDGLMSDQPKVEFEIKGISNDRKPYDQMDSGEMEEEIASVHQGTANDGPVDQSGHGSPKREDGGSIWKDLKQQEKVNKLPFFRHRPFGYR